MAGEKPWTENRRRIRPRRRIEKAILKQKRVESGYFAVRAALAKAAADAAEYIATGGVVRQTAPPLVRFIGKIAARFGMVVTDKAVAQVIPVLGAAGGAAINMLFIDHFQSVARGHCIVRRLERTYDPEQVKDVYLNLPTQRQGEAH